MTSFFVWFNSLDVHFDNYVLWHLFVAYICRLSAVMCLMLRVWAVRPPSRAPSSDPASTSCGWWRWSRTRLAAQNTAAPTNTVCINSLPKQACKTYLIDLNTNVVTLPSFAKRQHSKGGVNYKYYVIVAHQPGRTRQPPGQVEAEEDRTADRQLGVTRREGLHRVVEAERVRVGRAERGRKRNSAEGTVSH